MLSSLRKFGTDEVAQQRLRIMEFYDRYGEQVTKEAFGADRKVISRWRQKLKQHEGALEGLLPESTRPKQRQRLARSSNSISSFTRRQGEFTMIPVSKDQYSRSVLG